MPDLAVHAAVEKLEGGDINQQPSAWLKTRPQPGDRSGVVRNVLEYVERVDEIEALRRDLFEPLIRGKPVGLQPGAQPLVWFDAVHPVAGVNETPGEHTHTGAEIEDLVAGLHLRRYRAEQESVVVHRIFHDLQIVNSGIAVG